MESARTAWLLVVLLGAAACGSRPGLALPDAAGDGGTNDAGASDAAQSPPDGASPDDAGVDRQGDDSGCPTPIATSTVHVVANVSADSTPPSSPWSVQSVSTSNFSIASSVYDALGRSHETTIFLVNAAVDSWAYHVVAHGAEVAGGAQGSVVEFASGALTFASDGSLASTVSRGGAVTFEGADPSMIDYELELTQLSGSNWVLAQSQDGVPSCGAAGDGGSVVCSGSQGTTTIGIVGNLSSLPAPATTDVGVGFGVYDPSGGVHSILARFGNTSQSQWSYRLVANGSEVAGATNGVPVEFASGSLTFLADGSMASSPATAGSVVFRGAPSQTIAIGFDGLPHLASPSVVAAVSRDGRPVCAALPASVPAACTMVTPTGAISISANFDADAAMPGMPWDLQRPEASSNCATAMKIVDSLGRWHPVGIYFAAEAGGLWAYHVLTNAGETSANPPGPNLEFLSGELVFNPEGALQSNYPSSPGTVLYAGAQAQTVALNLGTPIDQGGSGFDQSTQLSGSSEFFAQGQDGHVFCAP